MTLVKFNHGGREVRFPVANASVYGDLLNTLFDNKNLPEGINALPPVNIAETDKSYEIELASPGRIKEDFQIGLENGVLKVSTEKKEESKEENQDSPKTFVRREFKSHAFTRTFNLPEEADENSISAVYVNGILQLKIGKKEDVILKKIARKIEIS